MNSQQERVQRARHGSRRKRDLDAVRAEQIDWDAWLAENLPDEVYGYALVAAQLEHQQRPPRDRRLPTRDEVLDRLRRQGRDMATLGGKA